MASPDSTRIGPQLPRPQLTDAEGVVWTIDASGWACRNGARTNGHATAILWFGGAIYACSPTGGYWWQWRGANQWTKLTTADPSPEPPPSDELATLRAANLALRNTVIVLEDSLQRQTGYLADALDAKKVQGLAPAPVWQEVIADYDFIPVGSEVNLRETIFDQLGRYWGFRLAEGSAPIDGILELDPMAPSGDTRLRRIGEGSTAGVIIEAYVE